MKVFPVASTQLLNGFTEYLESIGANDWKTNSVSEGETLVEAAGRLCYRSWFPYDPSRPDCTNPNVEKIREGNKEYIGNIIRQGHLSVLEHVNVSIIFKDISRVFSHELIRHRAGMSYSQESMRYVRLNQIPFWQSRLFKQQSRAFQEVMLNHIENTEQCINELTELSGLNTSKDFGFKKALTSLIRRIIPQGVSTTILATGNLRAWRHIIALRTSGGAEEEIQIVMDQLGHILKEMYPAAFQDMSRLETGQWIFEN